MKDKDIISLITIFFIFMIFVFFSKSFIGDVETKRVGFSRSHCGDGVRCLPNDPLTIKFNKEKKESCINTFNSDNYVENKGFINELLPKSNYKVPTINIDKQFTEAKEYIPIDNNVCSKKNKYCPMSKEYKTDLPLANVPMCYILDQNKSVKLSNEIKKFNV